MISREQMFTSPACARRASEALSRTLGRRTSTVRDMCSSVYGGTSGRAQLEEIAPAFVFLASSYITGEILPVIGGYDN